jgi:hypothetical protein
VREGDGSASVILPRAWRSRPGAGPRRDADRSPAWPRRRSSRSTSRA